LASSSEQVSPLPKYALIWIWVTVLSSPTSSLSSSRTAPNVSQLTWSAHTFVTTFANLNPFTTSHLDVLIQRGTLRNFPPTLAASSVKKVLDLLYGFEHGPPLESTLPHALRASLTRSTALSGTTPSGHDQQPSGAQPGPAIGKALPATRAARPRNLRVDLQAPPTHSTGRLCKGYE
jgi:hypothetical protein